MRLDTERAVSRPPAPTCLGDPRLVEALRTTVIEAGLAPSCAVAVVDGGRLLEGAVVQADVQASTELPPIFDLASVTKPLTATVALHLVATGELSLDTPLSAWLPMAAGTKVAGARLGDLLAHRAGLPAWGALYLDDPFSVGPSPSPAPVGPFPSLSTMLARATARCDDAGREVYSDLGYVLLGAALGLRLGSLRRETRARTGLGGAPPEEAWARTCPTEDVAWRGGPVRGRVHDENAFALEEAGGEPGHAGAFGTAAEVAAFGVAWLSSLDGHGPLPRDLATRAVVADPGGTHGLGWDTRSGTQPSSGRWFGPRTFGHLGFTGTSLWMDPAAELVGVLLTNRVHPTRAADAIRRARPAAYDAIAERMLASDARGDRRARDDDRGPGGV